MITKRILEPEAMDTLEEVAAYNRIAEVGRFFMDRPQIRTALKFIAKKDALSILDIGCGTARIPIAIAKERMYCRVYALDYSLNMLKAAKENSRHEANLVLLQADAKKLPFKNNSFDAVTCANMLHHLENPIYVLNEIKRVAKDKGVIVLRDLVRPRFQFTVNFLVSISGLFYDEAMKKEYRDSLLAAFIIEEHCKMLETSDIKDFRICKEFPHFVTIVINRGG